MLTELRSLLLYQAHAWIMKGADHVTLGVPGTEIVDIKATSAHHREVILTPVSTLAPTHDRPSHSRVKVETVPKNVLPLDILLATRKAKKK